MSKVIDWDSMQTGKRRVDFDTARREATGSMTGRELFRKAYEGLEKAQATAARRAEVEPILKSALIQHMVNKLPIRVMTPINNPTETLGGLNKSLDDDDGFYNSSPSQSQESVLSKKYVEVMEVIPAGTELVFKSWDKPMGQWLFKGSNGKDYAIYDKPQILFQDQAIENPGLYGLLFCTNLVDVLPTE